MVLKLSNSYVIFCALVLSICIGCSPREPFVYNEEEFNRDAPTFGKKKTNITNIRICYSKISATSEKITLLAEKECGTVNKYPRFIGHDTLFCPISTPTGAKYECESN